MSKPTHESRRARAWRGVRALFVVAATLLGLGQIVACVPGTYYVSPGYGYGYYGHGPYYRYGYGGYYQPYYGGGPYYRGGYYRGVVVAPPRPGVIVAPPRPGVIVAPPGPRGAIVAPGGGRGHGVIVAP
jgi:hypothetical protein